MNLSVNTPYPGTETWLTESRRLTTLDYRLFDIQHAVLPTRLPLDKFYRELVATQKVLARKHLGWRTLLRSGRLVAERLAQGQTNFVKMLFKFNSVYNAALQLADHQRPVRYEMRPPPASGAGASQLVFIHPPKGRRGRALDEASERFVEATRMRSGDGE